MKQVILLEGFEIARLEKGRQIEISTPSGSLMIGFDRSTKDGDAVCKTCGKGFRNAHGLAVHNHKIHRSMKHEKNNGKKKADL